MLSDPIAIARLIIEDDPHPIVDWRLRNEVLQLPECGTDAAGFLAGLQASRHYRILSEEQLPDGGWGRMHSMDTSHIHSIPTTEYAVSRAVALGVDANDTLLRNAADYLAGVLEGRLDFPDPPESNDRWHTGTRLFCAATLTLIDSGHPAIDPVWELWGRIVERTFASGEYCADTEAAAHREITGIDCDLRYLRINNRYSTALLASRSADLPGPVNSAYQRWLWNLPGGLGYLEADISAPSEALKQGPVERWFTSLELLSLFHDWQNRAGQAIEWLWGMQLESGLWDFGPRSSTSHCLPLSEDWKMATRRRHDWTVRVLAILADS